MSDVLARLLAESPPQRVPADLGTVVTPSQTLERTKFFITNDHVLVFADQAGQPTLVAQAEIVGFDMPDYDSTPPRRGYRVRTAEGETWELTPTNWCGCGSSLKHFSPFAIARFGT